MTALSSSAMSVSRSVGGTSFWASSVMPAGLALGSGRLRAGRQAQGDRARVGIEPFIGARELWWPTLSDFERGGAGDRAALDALLAPAGHDWKRTRLNSSH